jgi:hypothetical protein
VAVGSMDPLDIIRWRENGAGNGSLALVHLDAIASEDQKPLSVC